MSKRIDENEEKVIQEGIFFALISYVFFLVILTLLFKRENKFCLFHAKQGLVIFVMETVIILLRLLLGEIFNFFYHLGMLISIVLSVWGIISVLMGKYKKLPLIGEIASKIVI
ncbi:MAG: hypothetical protein B6D55_05775 [Candidatus Omnitrophica bacterium 4484_70.2]|nr:MAG: hypothetical protein B6D55_05775 [Candidatus Omnitrophica bacterium 4484_70.2]